MRSALADLDVLLVLDDADHAGSVGIDDEMVANATTAQRLSHVGSNLLAATRSRSRVTTVEPSSIPPPRMRSSATRR